MTNGQCHRQGIYKATGQNKATPHITDNIELVKPLLGNNGTYANSCEDAAAAYKQLHDEALLLWERYRGTRTTNVVGGSAALLLLLLVLLLSSSTKYADLREYGSVVQLGPYWHNFSHIDTWFPFGDSYTDMEFYEFGVQPTVENPLGNPPLPNLAPASGNGLTYVAYLAARYNHSFIKTYNMGRGGGTIDDYINPSFYLGGDLITNTNRFLENYCTNETGSWRSLAWKPERTLFSVFYGINDILTHNRSNPRLTESFASYDRSMAQLYAAGARNFVILNLPPMDFTPSRFEPPREIHAEANEVQYFNDQIAQVIERTKTAYPDTTIFSLDTHGLVSRMKKKPSSFATTRTFKDTIGRCIEYNNMYSAGDIPTRKQIARCGGRLPVHYLWHDLVHLTWPAHEVFAQALEVLLMRASDQYSSGLEEEVRS